MQITDPQALAPVWRVSTRCSVRLDVPRIMAVLNVTPDSFSDGGQHEGPGAIDAAASAIEAGADLLDIGGESTRPGAKSVPAEEQIRRAIPAIQGVRRLGGVAATIPITIDTTLAPVARAALDAGADGINDVSAGTEDGAMLRLGAERGCGVVLMHRLAPPSRDVYSDEYRSAPAYGDVVAAVRDFLDARARAAVDAGVAREAIVIDPGLGFGKSVKQNLALVRRTGELCSLGYPVLSGASRKSFTGRAMGVAGSSPRERLPGSIAISLMHYLAGARIFRVHDVAEQRRALLATAMVLGG